jgi:hypothetical protein
VEKLKKALPHLAVFGAGTIVGLALATTVVGAKAVSTIAGLRAKAGI